MTSATPSNLTIPDRPLDVQKAILEAERESWYNTVFQSRARLEAQELIQRTFKREGGDGVIKQLTESIEDAVVAIGHYDKKLATLEKLVAKAKEAPESAKAAESSMAAKTYLEVNTSDGRFQKRTASALSLGAANAGDLVALDDDGVLDLSLLPFAAGMTNPMTANGDLIVGAGGVGEASVNVALGSLGVTATSSTNYYPTTTPDLAIDGNATTYWLAYNGVANQWIALDLGTAKLIGAVQMLQGPPAGNGHADSFRVQSSADGVFWNTVVTITTAETDTGNVPITPTSSRYWRFFAVSGGPWGWTVPAVALFTVAAGAPERLPIGADTQVLTVVAGEVAWADSGAGSGGGGPITLTRATPVNVKARKTSPQTLTAAQANPITFDVEDRDSGGTFSLTTSRWTPGAGLIHIIARVEYTTSSDSGHFQTILKNGVAIDGVTYRMANTGYDVVVEMTATDIALAGDYYSITGGLWVGGTSNTATFEGYVVPDAIVGASGGNMLAVREISGSPNIPNVIELRVPNGSITDLGDGAIELAYGIGGGDLTNPMTTSGDLIVGADGTIINEATVAQGASASASSSYSGYSPGAVIDLSDSVRWVASGTVGSGEWVKVDLGSAKTIVQYRIREDSAGNAHAWELQWSSDNSAWTTVLTESNSANPHETGVVDITPVSARYWRMLGLTGTYGWNVYAIELLSGLVAGTPARLPLGSNTQVLTVVSGAVGWAAAASGSGGGLTNPMTAAGDLIVGAASGLTNEATPGLGAVATSHSQYQGYAPAYIIDGSDATMGHTQNPATGKWYVIDLATAKAISAFRVLQDNISGTYTYTLQSSTDNSAWTDRAIVAPATATSGSLHDTGQITLAAVISARYWRIFGTALGGNGWGVFAFELLSGQPAGTPAALPIGADDAILRVVNGAVAWAAGSDGVGGSLYLWAHYH